MTFSQHSDQQLVLGVDGGQSGTQTVLATTEGEILAAAVTGPMVHAEAAGGAEQVLRALRQGYEQVFTSAGIDISQVRCVHLGLSGVDDLELVRPIYHTDMLTKSGDAHIALMGAFPDDGVGIVVTSGTGSHAYGRRADGMAVFTGGRGYYMGDEGSASDIARHAFQAVYQADDGRGEQTALTALILGHFQCRNLIQLMKQVYAGTYDRHRLAQVSKLVGQAAVEGDQVARRILAYAGDELGKAVAAGLRALEQTEVPFPIAPNGGVFNAGRFITESMMARVRADNPLAYLTEARFSPSIGAILSALRDLDIVINERILRNIEASRTKIFEKDTVIRT
jgi:N-acetylglucosamine kinase-like BadF-type ATPase